MGNRCERAPSLKISKIDSQNEEEEDSQPSFDCCGSHRVAIVREENSCLKIHDCIPARNPGFAGPIPKVPGTAPNSFIGLSPPVPLLATLQGTVHVLISACGSSGTKHGSRSREDAKRVEEWCRSVCGIEDIIVLSDHHHLFSKAESALPTKNLLRECFDRIGRRTQAGDSFVWYFAGHGIQEEDEHCEEYSSKGDALLVESLEGRLTNTQEMDAEHKIYRDTILTNEELNQWLADAMPIGVTIFCIVDSCHSGTLLDLSNPKSPLVLDNARCVVSISACAGSGKEMDRSCSGVLTETMLSAANALRPRMKLPKGISCADFFIEMQCQALAMDMFPRNMTISALPDNELVKFVPWPLNPKPSNGAPRIPTEFPRQPSSVNKPATMSTGGFAPRSNGTKQPDLTQPEVQMAGQHSVL